MKYHSTKITVFTMFVIVISLFFISFISIRYFNAQTPIQAVTTAIIDNLEIPSDYSIEINDINESFLKSQKIGNITVKKGSATFIEINDVYIELSIVDYIKLFFNRKQKLKISVDTFKINYNENFQNFFQAFSKIQIKDDTFSNQDIFSEKKAESSSFIFDFNQFNQQISKTGSIDFSPYLPSSLLGNSIDLEIGRGEINYQSEKIDATGILKNASLSLSSSSIIDKVELTFINYKMIGSTQRINGDLLELSYNKSNLLLSSKNFSFDDDSFSTIKISDVDFSYSLLRKGIANLELNNIAINLNNTQFEIDKMNSELKTNLKDFSLSNSIETLSASNQDNILSLNQLSFALSFVQDKFSMLLKVGANNKIVSEKFGEIYLNNLQLSSQSQSLLPDIFNLEVENINYLNRDNIFSLENFNIIASAKTNKKITFIEDNTLDFDKLSIDNLKSSYDEILLEATSSTTGSIGSINNDFNGSIDSTLLIENNFDLLTVSANLNDIIFSDIDDPLNLILAYQGPFSLNSDILKMVETQVLLGPSFKANLVTSWENELSDSQIEAYIELNEFLPNNISSIIETKLPLLNNYIDGDTSLSGSLNLHGSLSSGTVIPFGGQLDSQLVFNNIRFGNTPINLGFTFDSFVKDSTVNISQITLGAFNYRLAVSGNYNFETKIPTLSFDIATIDTGKKMVVSNLFENEKNKIGFDFYIPQLEDFSFTGNIDEFNSSKIILITQLNFLLEQFPVKIDIDRKELEIKAYSPKGIDFSMNLKNEILSYLDIDNVLIKAWDNSYINGKFSFNFKDREDWYLVADNLSLKYNIDKLNFGLSADLSADSFNISNFVFENNTLLDESIANSYFGTLNYKKLTISEEDERNPYELNASFGDGREQSIDVAASSEGITNNVFLDISNFDISPLLRKTDPLVLNFRLVGNTNFEDIKSFRGKIAFADKEIQTETEQIVLTTANSETGNFLWKTLSLLPFVNLPDLTTTVSKSIENIVSLAKLSFESDVRIEDSLYSLENISLQSGDLNIKDSNLSLDSKKKEIDFNSMVSLLKHSKNTNQDTTFNLGFNLQFDSVFETIKNKYFVDPNREDLSLNLSAIVNTFVSVFKKDTFNYQLLDGLKGSFELDNIDALVDTVDFEKIWEDTYLDQLIFTNLNFDFTVDDSNVSILGENIEANIDLVKQSSKFEIDKNFGIGLIGDLKYGNKDMDLLLTSIYVPVNLVSRLIYKNIMKFYGGNISGNLRVDSLLKNPKFFGSLNIDSLKMKFFWLGDALVSVNNTTIIAYGNQIYANNIEANYYNPLNNKTSEAIGNMELVVDSFKNFNFKVVADAKDDVYVFVPIIPSQINMTGYGKNHFEYETDGIRGKVSGDLIVNETVIKGKLDPFPSWIVPSGVVDAEFNVRTENNVTLYYPDFNNPIIKATSAKDQEVYFSFDSRTKKFSAEGEVNIAQGEIFYFQKNFYITSGSIKLGTTDDTNNLNLLLSLSATLKEIDVDGNSININLSLNNSPINNLFPIFSSYPARSQKEIVSILGQSVTGSSSQGNDVSVGGLATAATSIFSTLGYINTSGTLSLNNTIAKILNLDIFSLNSNIVENLVLDTININQSSNNFSPLAKYLNNTSIYMGKYLTNLSYFQLMINLIAKENTSNASFLASDLALDLEVSYEVNTPLAKFSFFTNPQQLSIIDILDTIGFSVTKTIQLR